MALSNEVWNVSHEDFPASADIETQLRFLLRYAILAPSPKNSQPWAFAVREKQIHLLADLARSQPVSDPDRRELYLGLGCALENLLVAAEHFGFHHAVTYFPQRWQPELVATILFTGGGKTSPARAGISVDTILQRHNDPGVFRSRPVPAELRRRLHACCVEPDLALDLSDDHLFRNWIDTLTMNSDRIDFANPAFRMELAYWTSQGVFEAPRPKPGVKGHSTSHLDLGEAMALHDHAKVESAALLGLIRATGDSHLTHVRAGQLFERVWLTATAIGLSVNPMSQTMRRPELRSAVATLIPTPGWVPQHVFRLGYSAYHPRQLTHRRAVDDVLL